MTSAKPISHWHAADVGVFPKIARLILTEVAIILVLAIIVSVLPTPTYAQTTAQAPAQVKPSEPFTAAALETKITSLDRDVFDAYNRCDLKKFGDFIAVDVEFFHDNGGLMSSRAKVVEATEKFICNKVRRELVAGSLRVYPIKDYGAIAIGEHRFCEMPANDCVGISKFTNVWRNQEGVWQMTRILSYDHQAIKK
jgi:Domain of unknown function (DUF4440)